MSSFIEKNKALLHRVYQTLAVGMFEGDKEAAAELRTILELPASPGLRDKVSPELCNTCGSITARLNRDGCAKWCCHCGNRLTGTYVPSALEIEDE